MPTLTEAGVKNADVPIFFGFYGPKNIPTAIVETINGKMRELARNEEFLKKLWLVNAIPAPLTPGEMRKMLEDDIKGNLEVIKEGNIKLE